MYGFFYLRLKQMRVGGCFVKKIDHANRKLEKNTYTL